MRWGKPSNTLLHKTSVPGRAIMKPAIKNVCEELIVMQLQALPLDPDKANQMISRLDKTRNLRHSNYELQKMKLNTSLLEIPERMEEKEGSGYIEYTSHEFDQQNELVESKPIFGE